MSPTLCYLGMSAQDFSVVCVFCFFQLQNEPNLDNNDYIREYFQSQKALYRQQIEVRRQYRGEPCAAVLCPGGACGVYKVFSEGKGMKVLVCLKRVRVWGTFKALQLSVLSGASNFIQKD